MKKWNIKPITIQYIVTLEFSTHLKKLLTHVFHVI